MSTHDDAASGKTFTRRDILAAGGAAAGALMLGAGPARAAMPPSGWTPAYCR